MILLPPVSIPSLGVAHSRDRPERARLRRQGDFAGAAGPGQACCRLPGAQVGCVSDTAIDIDTMRNESTWSLVVWCTASIGCGRACPRRSRSMWPCSSWWVGFGCRGGWLGGHSAGAGKRHDADRLCSLRLREAFGRVSCGHDRCCSIEVTFRRVRAWPCIGEDFTNPS